MLRNIQLTIKLILGEFKGRFVELVKQDFFFRSFLSYCVLLFFCISNLTTSSPGYDFKPRVDFTLLLQISALFCLYKITPRSCSKPLDGLQVFIAIFLTIPSIILAFHNSFFVEIELQVSVLVSLLIVHFILHTLAKIVPMKIFFIDRQGMELGNLVKLYLILVSSIVCTILLMKPDFNLVSFEEIYSLRQELNRSLQQKRSPILSFALGWLAGLVPGILLLFSLLLRRISLLLISIVVIVTSYALTYQKTPVAISLLVILLFFVSDNSTEKGVDSRRIFNVFSGIAVASVFISILSPNLNAGDAMVRRPLLDPSIMYQYYLRFSTEFPHLKWSDMSILNLSSRPNELSAGELIGDRYFYPPSIPYLKSEPRMNATTGVLADSLAQFGIMGLVITTIFVFLFFYLLQSLSIGRDGKFTFVLTGLSAALLMEGTLHTSLLSRALILVPILIFLLKHESFAQNK